MRISFRKIFPTKNETILEVFGILEGIMNLKPPEFFKRGMIFNINEIKIFWGKKMRKKFFLGKKIN